MFGPNCWNVHNVPIGKVNTIDCNDNNVDLLFRGTATSAAGKNQLGSTTRAEASLRRNYEQSSPGDSAACNGYTASNAEEVNVYSNNDFLCDTKA